MKMKRNLKERLCALVLALLMPLTSVLPHAPLMVKAAGGTATDVTFTVKDSQGSSIKDAEVAIYDGDAEEALETKSTDASGEVVFSLNDSIEYQFQVIKGTYAPTERKKVSEVMSGDKVDVTLEAMKDIVISPAEDVVVEIEGTASLDVSNPVERVEYKWLSADSSIASVDETTGDVTGIAKGTTTISVTGNGMTQTKTVTVKETPTMSVTVSPEKGPTVDGQEVTSVKLEAQLPTDADGKVTFYKDEVNQANKLGEAEVNSQTGSASLVVNESDSFKLIGTQTFWAVYPGSDTSFYMDVRANTSGAYLKKHDLALEKTEETKNYGDAPFQVPKVDSNTVENRDVNGLTYASNNPDVVTVDSNGELTITGIGDAEISVTIPKSDTYTASTAKYKVHVDPKNLGTIEVSEFVWQSVSKVYDGKTDIEIQGKLTSKENSNVVGNDVITVTANANINNADAGEYTECTIGNVLTSGNDNYNFTVIKSSGATVQLKNQNKIEVTRRPVYIQIAKKSGAYESTVSYGQTNAEIEKFVKDDNQIVLAGNKGQIDQGAEQGLLNSDTLTLKDYAEIVLHDQTYYVSDTPYPDAIRPRVTNKEAGKNYEIHVQDEEQYYGRLKVTKEVKTDAEIRSLVEVNNTEDGIYQVNGSSDVWVRSKMSSGGLKFSLTDSTYYNQIMVSPDGGNNYVEFPNNNGQGIQFNDEKDVEKKLHIYLKNSNGGTGTRTVNDKNQDNQYTVKVDAENPTAKFTGADAGLFNASAAGISFEKFANADYPVTVYAADSGSGVASLETCIIQVKENSEIKQAIALAQNNNSIWTKHPSTTAIVTVQSQGNHIVLARIRDNVGNAVIYTSNGLVFETNKPKVSVTINNGTPIGEAAYDSTIPFTITVNDLNAVANANSGIDRIEVNITDNGTRVGDSTSLDADNKVVDSYTVTSDDIDKIIGVKLKANEPIPLAYLLKRASFTVNGLLSVHKYHTNQVTIEVIVYDKAGNKDGVTKANLCLDNIKPKVQVGYNTYDAKAMHYFQSREMTVKYTERNFDESLLSFDAEINGVQQSGTAEGSRLTLAELNAITGIQMTKVSDTESTATNKDAYTDAREITYKIQFSADGAYKIIPHIKDTAGNENTEVTYEKPTTPTYDGNELFVIDSKKPEIKISYDAYTDNGYYTSRVMDMVVTERNFDESLLSFEVEVNGQTKEGTAAGNRLTLAELRTIKEFSVGKLTDSEATVQNENSHTDNRTLAYQIEFKNDGCYKLIPHVEDKAGNTDAGVIYAEPASASNTKFYVDNTKPEIHAAYNDNTIGVQNEKFFNKQRTMKITYKERNFSLEKARFDFTVKAGDPTVNVSETNITYDRLVELSRQQDHAFTVSAMEDNQKNVASEKHTDDREITFTITFGGDGHDCDYQIKPSVTDLAGNQNPQVKDSDALVQTGKEFTVDMVTPKLTVKYYTADEAGNTIAEIPYGEIGTEVKNSMYKNTSIIGEVTITERNFAARNKFQEKELTVTGTALDVNGAPVVLEGENDAYQEGFFREQNEKARETAGWEDKNDAAGTKFMKAKTFLFSEEANYTFHMSYMDAAGNTAGLGGGSNAYLFTVDKTAPEGKITLSGEEHPFITFLHTITFNIFRNDTETITMESEDKTSPHMQKYYIDDPDPSGRNVTADGAFDALTPKELEAVSEWTQADMDEDNIPDGFTSDKKSQTYQTKENTKSVPYVYVEDRAGNKTYYNSNGVVDDRMDPESPEITITTADPATSINDSGKEIYNTDVNFHIQVTDPIPASKAYSGIAKVSYRIIKDGDAQQPTQQETFKKEFEPKSKRVQTWGNDLVVEGKLNNSNDIVIEVTAEDNAGNITTETRELAIDMTDPKVTVSYDNNDAVNGSYFKEDRVMTVSYTERNFEETLLTFDVWLNGKNKGNPNSNGRVTFEELKKLDGIRVESGPLDSQSGTGFQALTDERTNTYTIRFDGGKDKDMDYVIVPYIEDAAARVNTDNEKAVIYQKGTKAPDTFTVDKVAPTVKVLYKAGGTVVTPGEIEANRLYKNTVITAEVIVTERNFSLQREFSEEPKQMALSYEAKDVDGKKVGTENYTESANTLGRWASDGYIRTQVFTFDVDANYEFGLIYRDLAGNEVKHGTRYFTYDKTPPTGTITIDGEGTWREWFDKVFFNIFKKNTQEITLTSKDATAGVASTQYYKYIPDVETRGEFAGLTKTELDKITEWTEGMKTSVNPNEQAVIYEKIVDRAGNVTYINAEEGVIADDTDPDAPEIKITIADPSQGIYNSDVPFAIDVADPQAGGTYSGLRYVRYEVTSNGVSTQQGNYDAELTNRAARVQSIHHDETVNAELNNSNHVTIKVYAEDYAGNHSEATKDIKIDITEPEVQISYDLNTPSNGKYYNAVRTATVTVTERNFDPDQVDFTITNTDGTMPSISGWEISPMTGETDDAINTCTVTFAADGDYTITMNCTDRANNRSNYSQVDEFTIDRTVPVISVAFDNNSAANAGYYDKPRTATVTVNEHNFNGADVQAAISASLQSQGIQAPGLNGWSTSGDTHTAAIHFGADGDYSFTIHYTDLAGNEAAVHTQEKFTVDQTKPEIDIFDITDKSANNGTVAPGVKYSDVNYDAAGVKITIKGSKHAEKITIKGSKHAEKTITGTRSSIPNGESIKMADFEHKEEVDDVYTLTAEVTDLAGNVDQKSVMFSVNRFGSNYIFGDATKAFLDQYYAKEEQELIVTEINVDTLTHQGISYGLDGDLVDLEKGKDYTVKESGNEVSWKRYQYTINADNFTREGLYNVTIDSTDRAKNEVNNKVKDANIEFVIDKTKPTVVITGVENDGQYRTNSRDITIHVADNVAMESLEVSVDGTEPKAESFDAEAIQKQQGEVPFSLASSSNWQEITAVAADAAGNTAEVSEIRVLITSNLLVQFYRNTPLVVGSSAGLAAVAAGIYFLLARRKKMG